LIDHTRLSSISAIVPFSSYLALNNVVTWVGGHSRSLKLVSFENLGAVSYLLSIVTVALSCIVCEIEQLTGQKLRTFYTPPVFNADGGDDLVGIS